jgi:chemotaxis protein methyltransferase CheR
MLLAERGMLEKVDLVASDISNRALARAQTGDFSPRSLRQIPPGDIATRWIVEESGRIRVREGLREAIQWRRVNLVEPADIEALGVFDVILCRNVLIYFSDDTARRALARLSDALRPGGALFVGVSESLLRFGTSLVCEERGGVFCYRKEG